MQKKGDVCFFSVCVVIEITLVYLCINQIRGRRQYIIVLGPRKLFLWMRKRPTIVYYSDIQGITKEYSEVYVYGLGFATIDPGAWSRTRTDREFFVSELTRRLALGRQEQREQG